VWAAATDSEEWRDLSILAMSVTSIILSEAEAERVISVQFMGYALTQRVAFDLKALI
jgi:hypothetical protein